MTYMYAHGGRLVMAGELHTFRRHHVMCTQGTAQAACYVIVYGTAALRVTRDRSLA